MAARLRRRRSGHAVLSASLALIGLLLLVASALAHRGEAISTTTLYLTLALGVVVAVAAIVLAISAFVAIWRDGRSGGGWAALGFFGGAALLSVPVTAAWWIATIPSLADISTDWIDPPAFRFGAIPSPKGGTDAAGQLAVLQSTDYPQIEAKTYPASVPTVFAAVRKIALASGWQVLDRALPVGRGDGAWIESVALSTVFALRDEVVVRVEPDGDGARVDVHSASRVGRHDLGSNAARIKKFYADLDRAMGPVGG